MKKVAIYCRVSTDEQAKNKEGSLVSQVQRLKLKVDEKNGVGSKKWGKVVRVYKDEAYSGKNVNRPQFQRMILDIKAKKIDTVMVTELSRLSRSVADFLNFIKELEDYGCDFICPQYDFDTTSPAGRVFMTIIMALAQFERELTAERTKNNFHARALRGLSNGGTPFLGYDKNPQQPGRLLVNKEEAAVVREVFDIYLEAEGLADVAKRLNARGMRNKTWTSKAGVLHGGREFDFNSVWRTLGNYAYIGKREINKANKNLDQVSLNENERYSIVEASWDAIIDEGVFNKAQAKLKTNKRPGYVPTYDFFLSNLLVCDECGESLCGMSATGRNGTYFYYGHNKKTECAVQRYNAESLEKIIKKKLFALVQSETLRRQFMEAVESQRKGRPEHGKALLKKKADEIDALKLSTKKLTDLLVANPEAQDLKSLLAKIRENEELLGKHEREQERLEEALMNPEIDSFDPDFILSAIEKMRRDNFRKASLGRKKAFLREVVKGIHVHPENALRIDIWASGHRPTEGGGGRKRGGTGAVGEVLPYRELASPLRDSFRKYASKEDRFRDSREGVGLGTYVLSQECNDSPSLGILGVGGSYGFGSGVADGTRTHDNQNHNLALYRLNYGHRKGIFIG